MEISFNEILLLEEGFKYFNIDFLTDTIEKFTEFINELLLWNRKTNLIGTNDPSEIVTKHILDSLSIYPLLGKKNLSILDIGSGAGFPGLPLAIIWKGYEVTAVERRSKRAGFLRNVSNMLELKNFKVVEKDIRDLDKSLKYDIITARAFGDLSLIYELSKNYLKERAMIIAFKGRISELQKEVERLREKIKDKDKVGVHIEEVKIPNLDEEERHLVVIETV